jgi:hypothetical protein
MSAPRQIMAGIAQVIDDAQAELRHLRLHRHLLLAYKLSVKLGLTTVSIALRTMLEDLRNPWRG